MKGGKKFYELRWDNNDKSPYYGSANTRACESGEHCVFNREGRCIWYHSDKYLIKCYYGSRCSTKDKPNKYGTLCQYKHSKGRHSDRNSDRNTDKHSDRNRNIDKSSDKHRRKRRRY